MSDIDTILVVNAGSSSVKFSLYPAATDSSGTDRPQDRPLGGGSVEGIGIQPAFKAKVFGQSFEKTWPDDRDLGHGHFFGFLLDWLDETLPDITVIAAGHRVVHGGTVFSTPVLVDSRVMAGLEGLIPLAPLHLPHNAAAIAALAERAPEIPQVACFDTAFHRSVSARDQLYGLPLSFAEDGIRRYGFHGLSYEYIAGVLGDYDAEAAKGRTIVAHLGNGASLCALQNGNSRATTMGFSTLDGLIMGTRCGTIDPGVLIYLLQEKGMSVKEVETLLYKGSGLVGLSGVSADMRDLLASDKPEAEQAIEMFCDRIAQEAGKLAAVLGGVDAFVFTAGIGEHSAPIRAKVARRLTWLGADLNEAANDEAEANIAAPGSRLGLWIVPTDEESMIVQHTRALLSGRHAAAGA